jgi:ligand-binding SRPBCC domain-containing protein
MRIYEHHEELWLPRPRSEVFPFFADAANLERITPPWVGFRILTPQPIAMRPGTLIDYRIRVHGIPLSWRTEITAWEPPERFVDVQLRGPYRLWEHTHHFLEHDGGTLCQDHIRWAVWGGPLVAKLFVQRDVRAIFAYRSQVLRQLFPAPPEPAR